MEALGWIFVILIVLSILGAGCGGPRYQPLTGDPIVPPPPPREDA